MVIDGDAHWNEPKDLFERYLDKEFRDRGPKAVDAGGMRWLVEGEFCLAPSETGAMVVRAGSSAPTWPSEGWQHHRNHSTTSKAG